MAPACDGCRALQIDIDAHETRLREIEARLARGGASAGARSVCGGLRGPGIVSGGRLNANSLAIHMSIVVLGYVVAGVAMKKGGAYAARYVAAGGGGGDGSGTSDFDGADAPSPADVSASLILRTPGGDGRGVDTWTASTPDVDREGICKVVTDKSSHTGVATGLYEGVPPAFCAMACTTGRNCRYATWDETTRTCRLYGISRKPTQQNQGNTLEGLVYDCWSSCQHGDVGYDALSKCTSVANDRAALGVFGDSEKYFRQPGQSLTCSTTLTTPEQCAELCRLSPLCKAFTLQTRAGGHCRIFNSYGRDNVEQGTVSGDCPNLRE